ncbi:N-acetylmuramic acid 6-phosphate etherase [Mucisphaera calidilacus]|uniref:N-acetylmuramic acid 6-phosphate etherase n=1 Tax=Mucisphaera calidilacus TaxID=2527982 RepID=A0A518C0U7_9BACT|nr:N-acetylmuramic acid 6-phosphate etherase [Mucisphaera calidilacus]QDU72855.1 N-acetylmuramic acid 6-phosphate etherase [Mucisphaera calidilacus]
MIPNLKPSEDRGHLLTEQRLEAAARLDTLSTSEVLQVINDQDATVALAVRQAIPQITQLVDRIVEGHKQGGSLVYSGAGTSGRLGVLDASECPPTFHCNPNDVIGIMCGGDTALRVAVEGAEDDPDEILPHFDRLNLGEHDTFVGIAAGGTTPYVWGAIEHAKARGAATGLVSCVTIDSLPSDLPLEKLDFPVEVLVGPEVVTGSTRMKAGTATKLALNMITTATMVRLGKVWGNLMIDLQIKNAKLVDRAIRILRGQNPDMTRDKALEILHAAHGRVKLALVMAGCDIDAEKAQHLLEENAGRVRPLLGDPK